MAFDPNNPNHGQNNEQANGTPQNGESADKRMLNDLLRKKAAQKLLERTACHQAEDNIPASESKINYDKSHVNILPMPKTKMNRRQDEGKFEEGDYTPVNPELLKKRSELQQKTRVAKRKIDRTKERQKLVIQKRRVQKKRRVLFQRLKIIANIASFFLLLISIWVLAENPMWTFSGDAYQIHYSEDYSQDHQPDDQKESSIAGLLSRRQIQPIIEQYRNLSVYLIDPEAIAKAITERYRIVDQVYVRRSIFPARLDITIIEKEPFAEVYPNPGAQKPNALLVFETDANRYDLIPLAPYDDQYQSLTRTTPLLIKQKALTPIILPPKTVLSQQDLQRLDQLVHQLRQVQLIRLERVFISTLPKNEHKAVALEAVAQYQGGLLVFAGALDSELNQRIARLSLLEEKIVENLSLMRGIDLRWSEQITFIKKNAPLPIGVPNPYPVKLNPIKKTLTGPTTANRDRRNAVLTPVSAKPQANAIPAQNLAQPETLLQKRPRPLNRGRIPQ